MAKYHTYILRCSDGSYYTGSIRDLDGRLEKHNDGRGANYTRKRRPVVLVYIEEFDQIDKAFYREKQIQGWRRDKKEALIRGELNKLAELSKSGPSTTSTGSGLPGSGT